METIISLPENLFEEAEQLAERLGVSRSELYTIAIREYLRGHRDDAVTEALNRIYGKEDSSLEPGLALLEAEVLDKDDW